jgi:outer membrane lipoprotein-sorting protein
MIMMRKISVVALLFFLITAVRFEISSRTIIYNMLSAIDNLKTVSYTMKSWERFDGKDHFSEIDAKVMVNPQKVYVYSKTPPNKDVEVLYNESLYGNKAYVNAGRMIPNLKLDPFGSRMRNMQHHTILNTGFNTLGRIIKNALERQQKEAPNDFDKLFVYEGDVTWNGISCYKMVINDPTFTYIDYIVKEGDDVEKLERERFICGYLIIEKNPSVKDFWSLKPGMKIKIPSSYAKKTVLYIDKKTYLPVVQIMSDDVGQFEKYEFYNVKVNPVFKENEFTDSFEGYRF